MVESRTPRDHRSSRRLRLQGQDRVFWVVLRRLWSAWDRSLIIVRNHSKEVWACDFLTQYTAFFAVVQVFVIMEVGSRRIVHVNVTTNPPRTHRRILSAS